GPAREVADAIADFRPDLVHAHNTFPSLSPALAWAAARAGVPYVQTLHNFRLVCPQGMLQRDGRGCMDCVGRLPLPAVRHAYYGASRAATGDDDAMFASHRALDNCHRRGTRSIALTEFGRGGFIAGGLPAGRIMVKPNFVADRLGASSSASAGEGGG